MGREDSGQVCEEPRTIRSDDDYLFHVLRETRPHPHADHALTAVACNPRMAAHDVDGVRQEITVRHLIDEALKLVSAGVAGETDHGLQLDLEHPALGVTAAHLDLGERREIEVFERARLPLGHGLRVDGRHDGDRAEKQIPQALRGLDERHHVGQSLWVVNVALRRPAVERVLVAHEPSDVLGVDRTEAEADRHALGHLSALLFLFSAAHSAEGVQQHRQEDR